MAQGYNQKRQQNDRPKITTLSMVCVHMYSICYMYIYTYTLGGEEGGGKEEQEEALSGGCVPPATLNTNQ